MNKSINPNHPIFHLLLITNLKQTLNHTNKKGSSQFLLNHQSSNLSNTNNHHAT